ncbi:MAG: NUDIX hydrolase [Candidatus Saccharimonadaceae bacterium]
MDKLHKRVASAAALLTSPNGELLILKANYKRHWSLPGGLIDDNESILETALREIHEEIGLALSTDRLGLWAVVDRHSDIARSYYFVFKGEISSEEISQIRLQGREIDESRFVSKQQVLTNDLEYGKIITAWANNQAGYLEHRFIGASTDE